MKLRVLGVIVGVSILFACSKGGDKDASTASHSGGTAVQGDHTANEPISLGGDSHGGLPAQPHPETEGQKIARTIAIPEEVKGKWKGVKLLVKEKKEGGFSETKTLDIGSEFDIPDSNIHVKVGEFLPHMSIGENAFTSLSNDLINPAVNLIITENGKELYNGWAYAKFPDMYNFQHEKYSVTLVDFVPQG